MAQAQSRPLLVRQYVTPRANGVDLARSFQSVGNSGIMSPVRYLHKRSSRSGLKNMLFSSSEFHRICYSELCLQDVDAEHGNVRGEAKCACRCLVGMLTLFQPDEDETRSEDSEIDSKSLASSLTDYEYSNGRRYHAYRAGEYMLPNDETEQDRMDLLHHIW